MGREVRMVPPDWQHPKNERGAYIPLHERDALEYVDAEECGITEENVMPDFGDRATHLCMYEIVTEGTPMSPAFATAEELARWLADNRASTFADMVTTYEVWLEMITKGRAVVGLVYEPGKGFRSGVEDLVSDD